MKDEYLGTRCQATVWVLYNTGAQVAMNSLQNWQSHLTYYARTDLYTYAKKIHFIEAYTLSMCGQSLNLFKVAKVLNYILIM